MSWNVRAYLLDLERFRCVQGSKDDKLLIGILEDDEDRIEAHDAEWSSQFSPYLLLRTAVQQIIDGSVDAHARPLFQYEHAAALIARALGEELDADLLSEMRGGFWDDVNRVVEAARSANHLDPLLWPTPESVLQRGPLLSVPVDSSIPRETGYLLAEETREIAAHITAIVFDTIEYPFHPQWLGEAQEAADQYRDWIKQSAQKNLGLFLHY